VTAKTESTSVQDRRSYFEQLAHEWDLRPLSQEQSEWLREFCKLACPPGTRCVLDVGCGTGLLVPYLSAVLREKEWIVELDFAMGMLKTGRQKYWQAATWVCADACALPFAPATFDSVIMFGLLPHVSDQRAALEEALRVLQAGGMLSIGHLMSSEELNAFHSQLEGPVREDRLPAAGVLASLLERCGARVLEAAEGPGSYRVRACKVG